MKLGELNSRMKDFYDLHLFASSVNLTGEILAEAIQKTFTALNLHEPPRRLVDLPKIINVTVVMSDKFFWFDPKNYFRRLERSFLTQLSVSLYERAHGNAGKY